MYFEGAWHTLRPRVPPDRADAIAVARRQRAAGRAAGAGAEDRRMCGPTPASSSSAARAGRPSSNGSSTPAARPWRSRCIPVAVDDLMAVSDAGAIMPPKSTWFEPKLRDGLLIHVIISRISQFLRRTGRAAGPGPRRDPARSDRAARRGDVDPRDQPSLEDVRSDSRGDRGRHPGAGRRPVELSRAVSSGRRQPAVLHGADELSGLVGDRRLHRRRIVGRQGDQGSEESRDGQRRREHEGRGLHAHPGAGRAEADAGRGVRAHDVEQHHRGHRVQAASRRGRRAARQRHIVGHVQPPDRRLASRADLLRSAEEHGTGRA